MNGYSFGFNVFNFPAENFIDYALDNNLQHIEINLSQPHSSIESFTHERMEALKAKLADSGLRLSLHLPYKTNIADNIFGLNRMNVNYMCRAVELAGSLGAQFLTCHMGFFFWFPVERWKRAKALKRFVDNLSRILEISSSAGVVIALENVTPLPHGSDHLLLGDNVHDFDYIFSELRSPMIRFCLDTGHAHIAEGIDVYLDRFADRLISIHYHDNFGNDDQHLPVGQGSIDWKMLAGRLSELSFQGPLISECRNEKPHESAQNLRRFLL
jgi:sugar phosphate isomerase/epimerase